MTCPAIQQTHQTVHWDLVSTKVDPWEFVSTKLFWFLNFVLLLNAYWVDQQLTKSDTLKEDNDSCIREPGNNGPPDTEVLDHLFEPASTSKSGFPGSPDRLTWWTERDSLFFVQPHITTRFRQALVVLLHGSVLLLQLLQGTRILQTAFRVSKAIHQSIDGANYSILVRYILYLQVFVIVIAAWIFIFWLGIFLVSVQLAFVLRLANSKPGSVLKEVKVPAQPQRSA